MNILLLTREYPPHVYGGAGVVVDHLSRALARRASVEVRCFGDNEQSAPNLTVHGYRPWERLAGGPAAPYAPALEALERREAALDGPFDLAFIDALKHEYLAYVEALLPRLTPDALIVADNVLWSGRVSGERAADGDRNTEVLRGFDEAMLRDPRFAATILPLGDGLLLAGRRG